MSLLGAPLRLKVLARNGRVLGVDVESPRVDPSAVFRGKTPQAAAELAAKLFSLCPAAQSAAVKLAGGVGCDPWRQSVELLSERLAEMLRASLLDWPSEPPPKGDLVIFREILLLLRLIGHNPAPDLAQTLRELAQKLGLGSATGLFARQKAEGAAEDAAMKFDPRRADFLSREDDLAVVAAMAESQVFSRAPALPGRRVETGLAARRGLATGGLAARLEAREADIAETLAQLAVLLDGGQPPPGLTASGIVGEIKYGVVECARGRLYHACKLDMEGRIVDYRIVAPTEWNFHTDGPFVRALLGAEIGAGATAKRRVERLAFVYDPCIKSEAEIRETADA